MGVFRIAHSKNRRAAGSTHVIASSHQNLTAATPNWDNPHSTVLGYLFLLTKHTDGPRSKTHVSPGSRHFCVSGTLKNQAGASCWSGVLAHPHSDNAESEHSQNQGRGGGNGRLVSQSNRQSDLVIAATGHLVQSHVKPVLVD